MKETLTYKQLEALLAGLHGADDEARRGPLLGRIKHLRRMGLPFGESPGTGNRIQYTSDKAYQFAFCLELEEFGLDPKLIVSFLNEYLDLILRYYANAEGKIDGCAGYFFIASCHFMMASWEREERRFPGMGDMTAGDDEHLARFSHFHPRMFAFDLVPAARAVSAALRAP